MTTLALIHQTPVVLQKIADAVTTFVAGINEARTLAQRFDALSRLSDAELARRGLTRADIAKTVLGTRA